MARQQEGFYNFQDIASSGQTPNADVVESPEALFFPIARISPEVDMERMSLTDLVGYLNNALRAQHDIGVIHTWQNTYQNRLEGETALRQELGRRLGGALDTLTDLVARVTALEQHGQPTSETAGDLRYGLVDNNGTKQGTEATAAFTRIPSLVSVVFPAATEAGLHWYVEYPAPVMISHIYNDALQRQDEIGTWSFDSSRNRYTSVALTPHFAGNYSIEVVRAIGG